MPSSTNILIAGAGPTGLTAAILFAQAGIKIRIIDKNVHRVFESRAPAIQSRTLELFEKLGVIDDVLKAGNKNLGINVCLNGKVKAHMSIRDSGLDTPYPFVLFLPQYETEKILEAKLNSFGIFVERETELLDFMQDEKSVESKIKNKTGSTEIITSNFILGCDGAHSTVRHKLGLKFEGAPYEQNFLLADVNVEWDFKQHELYGFLSRTGTLVFFPMPGGNRYRLVIISHECALDNEEEPTLELIQELTDEITKRKIILSDSVWLKRFRLSHRGVENYRKGRAFLCGDAAHIHSPAGGQGMNTGIQDAFNLVWKVAAVLKDEADEKILDTYDEERKPIGRILLKRTDGFFRVIVVKNPVFVAIRNFLFPLGAKLISRFVSLRRRALIFISQIGIHYEFSSAVKTESKSKTILRAGRRVPDLKLTNDRNEEIRLFDLIKDYKYHLVLFNTNESPFKKNYETIKITSDSNKDKTDFYFDVNGEFRKKFGVEKGIFLIRPDGYLEYASDR